MDELPLILDPDELMDLDEPETYDLDDEDDEIQDDPSASPFQQFSSSGPASNATSAASSPPNTNDDFPVPYNLASSGKPLTIKRGRGRPRRENSVNNPNKRGGGQSGGGGGIGGIPRVRRARLGGYPRCRGSRSVRQPDRGMEFDFSLISPTSVDDMSLDDGFYFGERERQQIPQIEELPYSPEAWPGKVCAFCNLGERSQLGQGEMLRLCCPEGFTPQRSSSSEPNTPNTPLTTSVPAADRELGDKSPRAPVTCRRNKNFSRSRSLLSQNNEYVDELTIIGYLEEPNVSLLYEPNGQFYVHRSCALWSQGVIRTENQGLENVGPIVLKSSSQKCSFCSHFGASLQCNAPSECMKFYHYPCATASGAFQCLKSTKMFCSTHLGDAALNSEAAICYTCKNVGDVLNLMYCSTCGTHYHGNCVGLAQLPGVRAGWQCRKCRNCQVCRIVGDETKLMSCEQCDKVYHASCQRPIVTSIPKYGWKCRCCRVCGDCGSRTPGAGLSSRWHLHYTVCDSCYQQRNKGCCCPICQRAYRSHGHREMVQCNTCRKFVHGTCDPDAELLTYQQRKETNPEYEYNCLICKSSVQQQSLAGRLLGSKRSSMDDPSDMSISQESLYDDINNEFDAFASEECYRLMGLGKGLGKPYASSKIAKKKLSYATGGLPGRPKGSFGKGGGGGVAGKTSFMKRQQRLVEFGRKRGAKSKIRGVFGVPGVGLSRPVSDGKDEEPGLENKLALCSAKDKFVLTQDMCVMCGSLGTDQEGCLISCVQCGQCYHPYCVNVKITKVILQKGWRCLDCTVCEGCGQRNDESRLILCDDCDVSYHTYCMDPPLDYVPHGNWKCKWCACCRTCGTTDPGFNSNWMNGCSECGPCASLVNCPSCNDPYSEGDLIIQCSQCERWLHGVCDLIKNEQEAEKCSEDGYTCVLCRPRDVPPPHLVLPSALYLKQPPTPTKSPSEQRNNANFFIDGVCLNETGHTLIKSLSMEYHGTRKKRKKLLPPTVHDKEAGIMATIESVVAAGTAVGGGGGGENSFEDTKIEMIDMIKDEPQEQFKEGMLWTKEDGAPPEGFTIFTMETGMCVLRKKRQRNLQKLGIGGFIVRMRGFKSGQENDDIDTLPGQMDFPALLAASSSASNDAGDKPLKKKPIRRKMKSKLSETFPAYLQEAFFGKELMDLTDIKVEVESSEEEKDCEKLHAIRLNADEIMAIESAAKQKRIEKPIVEPVKVEKPTEIKEEDEDDDAGEDLKDVLVLPGDFLDTELVNSIINEDDELTKNPELDALADDDNELTQTLSSENSKDAKDELTDILNSHFSLESIPNMNSKEVEDIFKGVLTDESQESQLSQEATAYPAPSSSSSSSSNQVGGFLSQSNPPHPPPPPPQIPLQNAAAIPQMHLALTQQQQVVVRPNTLPGVQHVSFPSSPAYHSSEYSNSPQFSPAFSEPPSPWVNLTAAADAALEMDNNNFGPGGVPSLSSSSSSLSSSSTCNQRSSEKMKADESLGSCATISAVLYANMNHPEWKNEFPIWADRYKQIIKKWRTLNQEQKAPYLTSSRDNRSQLKMKKQQQDQEKLAQQQKTAREAEQERQWKQLQALRQQQAQQQQHVIHEQRVQAMARVQRTISDPLPPQQQYLNPSQQLQQQQQQSPLHIATNMNNNNNSQDVCSPSPVASSSASPSPRQFAIGIKSPPLFAHPSPPSASAAASSANNIRNTSTTPQSPVHELVQQQQQQSQNTPENFLLEDSSQNNNCFGGGGKNIGPTVNPGNESFVPQQQQQQQQQIRAQFVANKRPATMPVIQQQSEANRQLRDLLQRQQQQQQQQIVQNKTVVQRTAWNPSNEIVGGELSPSAAEDITFRQPLPPGSRPRVPLPVIGGGGGGGGILRPPPPPVRMMQQQLEGRLQGLDPRLRMMLQQHQRIAVPGQQQQQLQQLQSSNAGVIRAANRPSTIEQYEHLLQQQQQQQRPHQNQQIRAGSSSALGLMQKSTNLVQVSDQEIPDSVTAELEKLEQETGTMAELQGVNEILDGLGDDDDELLAEMGSDFNILKYADPELEALAGEKTNILDLDLEDDHLKQERRKEALLLQRQQQQQQNATTQQRFEETTPSTASTTNLEDLTSIKSEQIVPHQQQHPPEHAATVHEQTSSSSNPQINQISLNSNPSSSSIGDPNVVASIHQQQQQQQQQPPPNPPPPQSGPPPSQNLLQSTQTNLALIQQQMLHQVGCKMSKYVQQVAAHGRPMPPGAKLQTQDGIVGIVLPNNNVQLQISPNFQQRLLVHLQNQKRLGQRGAGGGGVILRQPPPQSLQNNAGISQNLQMVRPPPRMPSSIPPQLQQQQQQPPPPPYPGPPPPYPGNVQLQQQQQQEQPLLLEDLLEEEKREQEKQQHQNSTSNNDLNSANRNTMQQQQQQQQPSDVVVVEPSTSSSSSSSAALLSDHDFERLKADVFSGNSEPTNGGIVQQHWQQTNRAAAVVVVAPPQQQQQQQQSSQLVVAHHHHHQQQQPTTEITTKVQMFNANLMPAPPLPPENIVTEQDKQTQMVYGQWLNHQNIVLSQQLRYYETEVQKLRKSKKSLNSKQRQLRKSGNQLNEVDSNELQRISAEQAILQKHLESSRKQSRQHGMLSQEYQNKQQQHQQQQQQSQKSPIPMMSSPLSGLSSNNSPIHHPSASHSPMLSPQHQQQSPLNSPGSGSLIAHSPSHLLQQSPGGGNVSPRIGTPLSQEGSPGPSVQQQQSPSVCLPPPLAAAPRMTSPQHHRRVAAISPVAYVSAASAVSQQQQQQQQMRFMRPPITTSIVDPNALQRLRNQTPITSLQQQGFLQLQQKPAGTASSSSSSSSPLNSPPPSLLLNQQQQQQQILQKQLQQHQVFLQNQQQIDVNQSASESTILHAPRIAQLIQQRNLQRQQQQQQVNQQQQQQQQQQQNQQMLQKQQQQQIAMQIQAARLNQQLQQQPQSPLPPKSPLNHNQQTMSPHSMPSSPMPPKSPLICSTSSFINNNPSSPASTTRTPSSSSASTSSYHPPSSPMMQQQHQYHSSPNSPLMTMIRRPPSVERPTSVENPPRTPTSSYNNVDHTTMQQEINNGGGGGGGNPNNPLNPVPFPPQDFEFIKLGLRGGAPMWAGFGRGEKRIPTPPAAAAASSSATSSSSSDSVAAESMKPKKESHINKVSILKKKTQQQTPLPKTSPTNKFMKQQQQQQQQEEQEFDLLDAAAAAAASSASTCLLKNKQQLQLSEMVVDFDDDMNSTILSSEISLSSAAAPQIDDDDDDDNGNDDDDDDDDEIEMNCGDENDHLGDVLATSPMEVEQNSDDYLLFQDNMVVDMADGAIVPEENDEEYANIVIRSPTTSDDEYIMQAAAATTTARTTTTTKKYNLVNIGGSSSPELETTSTTTIEPSISEEDEEISSIITQQQQQQQHQFEEESDVLIETVKSPEEQISTKVDFEELIDEGSRKKLDTTTTATTTTTMKYSVSSESSIIPTTTTTTTTTTSVFSFPPKHQSQKISLITPILQNVTTKTGQSSSSGSGGLGGSGSKVTSIILTHHNAMRSGILGVGQKLVASPQGITIVSASKTQIASILPKFTVPVISASAVRQLPNVKVIDKPPSSSLSLTTTKQHDCCNNTSLPKKILEGDSVSPESVDEDQTKNIFEEKIKSAIYNNTTAAAAAAAASKKVDVPSSSSSSSSGSRPPQSQKITILSGEKRKSDDAVLIHHATSTTTTTTTAPELKMTTHMQITATETSSFDGSNEDKSVVISIPSPTPSQEQILDNIALQALEENRRREFDSFEDVLDMIENMQHTEQEDEKVRKEAQKIDFECSAAKQHQQQQQTVPQLSPLSQPTELTTNMAQASQQLRTLLSTTSASSCIGTQKVALNVAAASTITTTTATTTPPTTLLAAREQTKKFSTTIIRHQTESVPTSSITSKLQQEHVKIAVATSSNEPVAQKLHIATASSEVLNKKSTSLTLTAMLQNQPAATSASKTSPDSITAASLLATPLSLSRTSFSTSLLAQAQPNLAISIANNASSSSSVVTSSSSSSNSSISLIGSSFRASSSATTSLNSTNLLHTQLTKSRTKSLDDIKDLKVTAAASDESFHAAAAATAANKTEDSNVLLKKLLQNTACATSTQSPPPPPPVAAPASAATVSSASASVETIPKSSIISSPSLCSLLPNNSNNTVSSSSSSSLLVSKINEPILSPVTTTTKIAQQQQQQQQQQRTTSLIRETSFVSNPSVSASSSSNQQQQQQLHIDVITKKSALQTPNNNRGGGGGGGVGDGDLLSPPTPRSSCSQDSCSLQTPPLMSTVKKELLNFEVKKELLDETSQNSVISDQGLGGGGGGGAGGKVEIKDENDAGDLLNPEMKMMQVDNKEELKKQKRRMYNQKRRQTQLMNKEVNNKPNKRPRKSSKLDEDYDSYIDSVLSQIRHLPPMVVSEPILTRNYGVMAILGSGDLSKIGTKQFDARFGDLEGTYGNACLPDTSDFYSSQPYDDAECVPEKPPQTTQRGFYDQEFPLIRFIDTNDDKKFDLFSREDTPDSVCSDSSAASEYDPRFIKENLADDRYLGLKLISDDEEEAEEKDAVMQSFQKNAEIPLMKPIAIRLKPSGLFLKDYPEDFDNNKENIMMEVDHPTETKRKDAAAAAATAAPSGGENIKVTLTLTSAVAEDIVGVLRDLANILQIPPPTTYQIVDRTSSAVAAAAAATAAAASPNAQKLGIYRTKGKDGKEGAPIDIQSILNGATKFCKHCDVVILTNLIRKKLSDLPFLAKDFELLSEGEELYFCSTTCYMQFALMHRSPSIPEEKAAAIIDHLSHQQNKKRHQLLQLQTGDNFESTKSSSLFIERLETSKSEDVAATLNAFLNSATAAAAAASDDTKTTLQQRKNATVQHKFWAPGCLQPAQKHRKPTDKEMMEMLYQLKITVTPPRMPEDTRKCMFCQVQGDAVADGAARLLNYDVDKWVHLNCALWSDGVYETVNGALMNLENAVQQSLTTQCAHCARLGATIRCFKTRCSSVYHLACAVRDCCVFFKNKTVFCATHVPKNEKDNELTTLSVGRRVYINRDENRQVAAVVMHHSDTNHLLRVGSLIFLNVGQLLPHQLQNFHTPSFIYPIGFKIIRFYWSMRNLNKRCRYICTILDTAGRPEFRVLVQEFQEDDVEFKDHSPKLAWAPILERIATIRRENQCLQMFPKFITGDDLFGLNEPAIVRVLESLPGIETLSDYKFKYGRNPLLELPLAINPSGAARTEPRLRNQIHWKRPHTQRTTGSSSNSRPIFGLSPGNGGGGGGAASFSAASSSSSLSSASATAPFGESVCPYSKQFVHSKSSQYKKMKQEWRNNVYLARSKIQGLGLYAARDLEKHTMVIEYIGEVIRTELSECREKQYEAKNRGIYMFRLDDDRVVDATLCGGLARYINHSCNPNCVAETVEIDRDLKIILFAKRRIQRGEELAYDYKFDIEDDQNKISCMCGAPNCRKWMN